ncbi:48_t:CDS:2, partial [Gigaspora rosea]
SDGSEEFEDKELEDHIYGVSDFEDLSGSQYDRGAKVIEDYVELDLITFLDKSERDQDNFHSVKFQQKKGTTMDRDYQIGPVPQNVTDQLKVILQDRQNNFVWDSKELGYYAPVLAYPNFDQPFLLFTDASDTSLGAILAQKDSKKQERVISYASRSLSPAKRNFTTTEKECLAA